MNLSDGDEGVMNIDLGQILGKEGLHIAQQSLQGMDPTLCTVFSSGTAFPRNIRLAAARHGSSLK